MLLPPSAAPCSHGTLLGPKNAASCARVLSLRLWRENRATEVILLRRVGKESGRGGCVALGLASSRAPETLLGLFLLVAESGLAYTGGWWKELW